MEKKAFRGQIFFFSIIFFSLFIKVYSYLLHVITLENIQNQIIPDLIELFLFFLIYRGYKSAKWILGSCYMLAVLVGVILLVPKIHELLIFSQWGIYFGVMLFLFLTSGIILFFSPALREFINHQKAKRSAKAKWVDQIPLLRGLRIMAILWGILIASGVVIITQYIMEITSKTSLKLLNPTLHFSLFDIIINLFLYTSIGYLVTLFSKRDSYKNSWIAAFLTLIINIVLLIFIPDNNSPLWFNIIDLAITVPMVLLGGYLRISIQKKIAFSKLAAFGLTLVTIAIYFGVIYFGTIYIDQSFRENNVLLTNTTKPDTNQPSTDAPEINPKSFNIILNDQDLIIGGVSEGNWFDSTKMLQYLNGGENFRFFSQTGFLGNCIGEQPSREQFISGSKGYYIRFQNENSANSLGHVFSILGKWNVFPREAQYQTSNTNRFTPIINELAASLKPRIPKLKIEQCAIIDLDGNGTKEILLIASNISNKDIETITETPSELPNLSKNKYSLVVLQTKVNGKARNTLITKSEGLTKYKIPFIADVDGDQKMEFLIRTIDLNAMEAEGFSLLDDDLYQFKDNNIQKVLTLSWHPFLKKKNMDSNNTIEYEEGE